MGPSLPRTLLAAALGLAGCATAQAAPAPEPRTFQPSDVARLQTVVDATICPDGQRVAYAVAVPREPFDGKDGPARVHLGVWGPGGKTRIYVGGKSSVGQVRCKPDSAAISFLAKRGDDKDRALYQIPVDGGEATRLLVHKGGIRSYSWHPDGNVVAFLATEPKPKEEKSLEDKGFDAKVYEESAEPVRVWIATLAPPGEDAEEPTMLALEGSASELHWSPDGTRLAVAMAPTSLIDDHYMKRRVRVVDPKSGKVLARLDNPGKLSKIRWSPDSKRLALLAGGDITDPSAGRLLVGDASGGALLAVLPDLEGAFQDLAWRDAASVVAIVNESTKTSVRTVHLDTGEATDVLAAKEHAWYRLSLARESGKLALLGDSPSHPREVFVSDLTGAAPTRATNVNPWLADIALGKQEVIRFPARDGLEIEGLLIHPVRRKKGRRVPLIVQVHGGPESHYRNGWLTYYSYPGQVAAGRGFAIFYPNYRGSTGRGATFAKLSQGDPAGKEFDDVVDGVDHLVSIGLVDKAKVGITGGSYGGYASAWGATFYSDRYAASVMFVGISDLVSKVGTTDIPQEMFHVHYGQAWPWQDWQKALERSPIFHAHKSVTPTLILHGDRDPRVDPGQSRELYRHLKLRGKAPVRLVLFPGEGHGNRRAASRIDYNLRMLRWMTHYLQGPGGEPPAYEVDYDAGLDRESDKDG